MGWLNHGGVWVTDTGTELRHQQLGVGVIHALVPCAVDVEHDRAALPPIHDAGDLSLYQPDRRVPLVAGSLTMEPLMHAVGSNPNTVDKRFWDQLTVAYQPIMNLNGERAVPWAYEALIRRKPPHSRKGAMDVLQRINTWEEHITLFRFVLGRSLAAVASHPDCERVTVNVEPFLVSAQLESIIMAELDVHEIAPSCLVIELTERSNIFDFNEQASPVIARLKAVGVQFFLDDFYAGSNNLDYLMRLDVSGVKFDRRLAQWLPEHDRAFHILRSLNDMMNECGVIAIVEGIEDRRTAEIAFAAGSQLGQGYALGMPSIVMEGFS